MSGIAALSRRETEVALLLMQGKSNKQIALALGISEHTVEFHLKNIYQKLGVSGRGKAMLELGKSVGAFQGNLGESGVADQASVSDNQVGSLTNAIPTLASAAGAAAPLPRRRLPRRFVLAVVVGLVLTLALALIQVLSQGLAFARSERWTAYTREAERPDISTVGLQIDRDNASGKAVHGQFGAESSPFWAAHPGYVIYTGIRTPALDHVSLQLRYSKDSPASVPILIFIDGEAVPRNRLVPQDQHSWEQFTWSGPIPIGALSSGVHSLELFTEGQQYGVADLDQLVLSR